MKRSSTRRVLILWPSPSPGLLGATLEAQQKTVLVATKVSAPPALDGSIDTAWNRAPVLTVEAVGGKNLPGGSSDVRLRALYTTDTVYFLMQYKDPTDSVRRSPWVKQPDGSWVKLKDPNDNGGDNNLYYEDKMAVLWSISSPAFEQRGCMSARHTGEGKPYGNKYTAVAGERLDMWRWKGVRTGTIGQVDDQYVDNCHGRWGKSRRGRWGK
jgi:Ethylbenzene dehydrogenase